MPQASRRELKNNYKNIFFLFLNQNICCAVLDLGLISIVSLGPRASTKVESHVKFNVSGQV